MSGDTLKIVESDLGRLAKGYQGDPSFDKQQLGDSIAQLQDHIRENLQRNNPDYADQLSKINTGYANYTRIRQAAAAQGSAGGVFTPAQLSAAVRAQDKSVGKGDYASKNALMQDLSDPAKAVLGNNYPDSGTGGRALMALAASAVAGGAIHPAIPLAAAAGVGAYTGPAQALLSTLLTKRYGPLQWAGGLAQKGVPLSALAGAGASTLLGQ